MSRYTFAKKSLGQNFLEDDRIIDLIVEHISPHAGETVIEIGPGRGAITAKLLETGAKVIAVELDRELAPMLRKEFAGMGNLTVIEADALTMDFAELTAG